MVTEVYVMGLFKDENRAAQAVEELRRPPTAWTVHGVHSPFPSRALAEAMHVKKSRVGWFTLAGGIIGFFTGFALAAFTALRWKLIVSGKPIVALVPFVIVGFEFTILFAILGNLMGFLTQARLPRLANLACYDPRCSGEHFGILASSSATDKDHLCAFFTERGGVIRVLD